MLMKNLSRIIASVVAVGLFAGGYAVGQNAAQGDARKEFNDLYFRMENQRADPADYTTLAHLYMQAPANPEITETILRRMLVKGLSSPVTQGDALIIAQNARIIELLEQQAKAK